MLQNKSQTILFVSKTTQFIVIFWACLPFWWAFPASWRVALSLLAFFLRKAKKSAQTNRSIANANGIKI